MKNRIILLLLFNCPYAGHSQWQNLGQGFDNPGNVLFYDTVNAKLYTGGSFYYADSILVNHITFWNGIHWDSLGVGAPYGYQVYSIIKYKNKIYASTVFYLTPVNNHNWFGWWNGQYWDTLSQRVNDAIDIFKEYNNELYIGGVFTKIGSQNAPLIAKYDGTNFTTFPLASQGGGETVKAIEFYQGNMYVGGNFYDTILGVNDLERWDGISFQPFGGNGLSFGTDIVTSMVVYNNELYIAGYFRIAWGDPEDFIMRWDGNQFHDVGGGLDGGVLKMKVYNNELYVAGTFSVPGSTQNFNMAKWNGTQWSTVCPSFTNNGISDFIIINNDLYITGSFDTIGNIHMHNITKYANVNQVNDISSDIQIEISPNPVISQLFISNSKVILNKILIKDILGNQIYTSEINSQNCRIDVSSLKSGIYFLSIETKEGRIVKKFVKE